MQVDLRPLGEAIRRFREQAPVGRISQFRLATLMQWEGTAPVVEIEKGRRRPRPETLNALGEALHLSPADVAYLHGLAGYRETTVMPSAHQVRHVLEPIEADIARRRYPVQVLDFQFRHWMVNMATAALVGGSVDVLTGLMQRGVHGFNVVFDSRLPVRQYLSDPEAVEQERMFRFKSHNLYRRHEPFYQAYPERMRHQLLPKDYARFVRYWNEVDVTVPQAFPVHPHVTMRLGSDEVTFVIHMVELLHLDRLVYVGYFEPRDDGSGNRERCEAYFARWNTGHEACICAWDFRSGSPPAMGN